MDRNAVTLEAVRGARAGAWEYVRADELGVRHRWRFRASPELRALLGLAEHELAHDDADSWLKLIEPSDAAAFSEALEQCLHGFSRVFDVIFRARHRDGSVRTLHARASVPAGKAGSLKRLAGLTTDITDFLAGRQRAELIASVFDSAVGGLLICDEAHRVVEANRTVTQMSGRSAVELSRLTLEQLLFANASAEEIDDAWTSVARRGVWIGRVAGRRRDETPYRFEVRMAAAGGEGGPRHYAVLIFDLDTLDAQVPITSAAPENVPPEDGNELRGLIDMAIKSAVNLRRGLTVLVLAIDRFDALIEAFGRRRTAKVLEACVRRLARLNDATLLCRQSQSDRLVLVVADLIEQRDIEQAFGRILEIVGRDIAVDGHAVRLLVSAGASVFPLDGVNADLLLQHAESALGVARRQGRGACLRIYEPELGDYASDRIHIEENLRKALKLGAFECHLQPKVRLENRRWFGAEALVRWRIGDTWIAPSRFIPIAEDSGLIKDLGRWVLWEAASRIAIWRREGLIGKDFRVAVNLAGAQIESELSRTVRAVLGYTQLPSRALMLEITETVIMQNPQETRKVIDELRGFGVGFALDDFGTGYTSMSQLQSLAIDEIKIDQSFVRALPDDPNSEAIVRSLITLGNGLKLDVIAEGIETEVQCAALMKLGCRLGQGFLFSKALPFDSFERALAEQREADAAHENGARFGGRAD
ncbi:putative bifunctional diguanylate cyclase/phosphodiesterase [Solimonas terrae]|uniref:EAL domain-containing protein n=1 Tax=Solimonas terrae TaxID=1396819 RepID=A0A6M2BW31_9GAMM|nr:GGDEF domain-containing phosphodiesterase [Solimonas terrae]NGY06698.1 EAL domain-containing protein [Solimonas terrae]